MSKLTFIMHPTVTDFLKKFFYKRRQSKIDRLAKKARQIKWSRTK